MAIVIELTPEQEDRLKRKAEFLGISPQKLAAAAIDDLLGRMDDAAVKQDIIRRARVAMTDDWQGEDWAVVRERIKRGS